MFRRRNALAAALAVGLFTLAGGAAAQVVVREGESLTVTPGSVNEGRSFEVTGGHLTINGARSAAISATSNGMITLDGARVERTGGGSNPALLLLQANAVVANSIISSAQTHAIGLNGNLGSSDPKSRATITGSQITGSGRGILLSADGTLVLSNSSVVALQRGTGTFAGHGLWNDGGRALITDGSTITGDATGIRMALRTSAQPADLDVDTWGVTVDGSRVEGKSDAAIFVGASSAVPLIPARIFLRNGAQLAGADDVLLRAAANSITELNVASSTLDGHLLFDDTANASITFTDAAVLNGTIIGAQADTTVTNGASWNLTGDSSIGDLTLGSGGTVKLGDGTAFNTLNVNGDFVGQGGTFVFNTVFGDDSSPSDKVVIAGDSSGTGNIVVNNINGTGAQTGEGIQLISVGGSSDASFVMPGRATAGIYEYLLYKGGVANPNDGAWYLRSTYTGDPCDLNPSLPICAPTDPGTPVTPVDPIDPGGPTDPIPLLRPEPGAYLANQAAAVHMFQQRRHDRGEPAFEHDGAGAWARVGRDQMHTTIAGQVDTRTHTNVLQIGSDLYRWGQTGRGQIGLMLATGEAETQATSRITGYGTRGKVKGDAVGLYGTWVQSAEDSAGLYVDGWLQYGRYDNRVQGNNLPRETYDATTRAASIEAGYGWAFANSDRGTWYLQPQAQVTYTDYKGDTLQEVNGTVVEDDRAGGLESRVGVRLFGHDNASGNRVQPFLAVNWLYTERGDAMRFDGERLDARLPTNRYEAQAGAQLRLGQRWSAWGDLRVQRGDSGYKDAGAQLGLRRAW
jgi:autotransporter family porin